MAVTNLGKNLYDSDATTVVNSITNIINISYYNVSHPQGLHLMAAAGDAAFTLTTGHNGLEEGQGEASAVMPLGQLMIAGTTNASMSPRTISEAFRNHTVMVSCLMFGAGVLGNLLALFVLATSNAEQRKTLFYKLVAGLAFTDLLGTTATSPVVIAVYLNNFRWVGGDATCHYFSFAMIFAGFATMLIVCSMSVERYICVRHPYIYHTRLSGTKFARLTLMMCWAVSMAIAALPLIGVGTNVRQYPKTWCFFDYLSKEPSDVAFNYIYAIIALVCVIVTFVCNVSVIYTLVNLRSRQSRLDASERSQGKRRCRATSHRFAEVQMMIMLIGVTIVFTFCFAPLMIFVLLCQTDLDFDSRRWVLTLVRVASFNPILDPWVYILCRREFVWRCVKFCRWLLRLRPIHRPLLYQQSLLVKDAGGGGVMLVNGSDRGNGGVTPTTEQPGIVRQRSWEDPYNPSCLAFCYQCLCLPPVPKTNASQRLSVTTWQTGHNGRSPSLGASPRRAVSADHISPRSPVRSGSSSLLVKPPSPSDRLLLVKFTEGGNSSRSVNSVV